MNLDAPVTAVMTRNPLTVDVRQSLSEARRILTEGGFHHVPVVSEKRLVGMLSSADLLRVSDGIDPVPIQGEWEAGPLGIRSLMSRELVAVPPDAPVRRTLELLSDGRFHSIPVVDDTGALIGLVTTTDLVRYVFEQDRSIH